MIGEVWINGYVTTGWCVVGSTSVVLMVSYLLYHFDGRLCSYVTCRADKEAYVSKMSFNQADIDYLERFFTL